MLFERSSLICIFRSQWKSCRLVAVIWRMQTSHICTQWMPTCLGSFPSLLAFPLQPQPQLWLVTSWIHLHWCVIWSGATPGIRIVIDWICFPFFHHDSLKQYPALCHNFTQGWLSGWGCWLLASCLGLVVMGPARKERIFTPNFDHFEGSQRHCQIGWHRVKVLETHQ